MAASAEETVAPAWLYPRSRSLGFARHNIKMVLIILTCIVLGYSVSNLYGIEGGIGGNSASLGASYRLNEPEDGSFGNHEQSGKGTSLRLMADQTTDSAIGPTPSGSLSLYQKITGLFENLKSPAKPQDVNITSTDVATYPSEPLLPDIPNPDFNATIEEELQSLWPVIAKRPTIGKVSMITGGVRPIYERAMRTHEAHDRMHGYTMHVLRESILPDLWAKHTAILKVLLDELARPEGERYEWIFWVDADTIILNPYIPIEMFLPPPGFEDVHLIVSNDWNGLNNGIFPMRVCRWSVEYMMASASFPKYYPDVDLQFTEQSAMEKVLQSSPKWRKHFVQAPQRWFNAYQGELNETLEPFQIRRGDFLVHFAGVGAKEERMELWLQRAEMHSPEWEMDVKHTSYPGEIKEFWEQLGRERDEMRKKLSVVTEASEKMLQSIEEEMEKFKELMDDAKKEHIEDASKALRKILEDEDTKDEVEEIKTGVTDLVEAAQPLQALVDKAIKILIKEAHEVIYIAETSTLNSGGNPAAETETQAVDEAITGLKELLMAQPIKPEKVREAMDVLKSRYELLEQKINDSNETEAAIDNGGDAAQPQETQAHGAEGGNDRPSNGTASDVQPSGESPGHEPA